MVFARTTYVVLFCSPQQYYQFDHELRSHVRYFTRTYGIPVRSHSRKIIHHYSLPKRNEITKRKKKKNHQDNKLTCVLVLTYSYIVEAAKNKIVWPFKRERKRRNIRSN